MKGFTRRLRHLFPLLLLLLGSITVAEAQSTPQARFDEANQQLEEGNYRQAISLYHSIEQQSVSGALYLNMGISYVQLDSLGKAKYYFLKAHQFEETEQRAENGLSFVESRFSRQSAVLPKLPWERFFDWLGTQTSPTSLLGFALVLLNLGACLYVATWFFPSFTKPLRYGGIGLGALSVLIILSGFYLQYLQQRYSQAVMIRQQTNVVERPADNATMVSQAYEGYTFTVDHNRSSEQQGWAYVRMSNGLYGWVESDEIMVL